MTPRILFTIIAFTLLAPTTQAAKAGKATKLFDGKTLKGWTNPYDWGEAWVEDGAIALKANKKFFLATEKKYSDFKLEVEVMLPPEGKSNSGIMFRCHVQKNKVFGYQAECDPTDRAWTGGLYDEGRRKWLHPLTTERGKKKLAQAPLGKWIKYRIECKGDHLQIFINGKKTTDYRDDMDASGYIALQHHGEDGQIYRFRNIRLTPL
ncbi:MAG: hypothetical protein CMO80_03650 [Verrucomicrobiales bacterium]|nr:hypothetical protein [Verrucomicrobiales bacterium]|tara:strand:- start:2786 stop:3406 length:621 start_codon:yes stop_codon:yes gene_type:complete